MYGSARGHQILQYKINPNPNTNPSSPYCIMRFIFGFRVHVPSREGAGNVVSDPALDWPTAVPEMKCAEIPMLVLARKYFRKIKRGDRRALSSQFIYSRSVQSINCA